MRKILIVCLFLLILALTGCGSINTGSVSSYAGVNIKEFNYEKTLYGTHKIDIEIHLENINYSDAAAKLTEKLIYQDKNFDDYAAYLEERFIENYVEGYYPLLFNDDGTQYYFKSSLKENYKIEYHDNNFIIIHYNSYVYTSGAAHGIPRIQYYIIDIAQEKILTASDIITPVSDAVLKELIVKEYDILFFLRDNIWPPDSINVSKDGVFLLWNVYTITAYVYGPIYINLPQEIAESHLTEKGKALVNAGR